MPEREMVERAQQDAREGKSPNTQAGEFVREEMDHIREGKHGASSTKQAIAIGLSKARRAGVNLPTPVEGKVTEKTRKQASRDSAKSKSRVKSKISASRSRATSAALKKEGRTAASHAAISKQARSSAKKRGAAARHRSAVKAAATRAKGGRGQSSRRAA
jgi:Family of unknown function (DUF6496)